MIDAALVMYFDGARCSIRANPPDLIIRMKNRIAVNRRLDPVLICSYWDTVLCLRPQGIASSRSGWGFSHQDDTAI